MRLLRAPSTLFCAVALVLASNPTAAKPYPRELAVDVDADVDITELQNTSLARRCANPCGWQGQLCCAANQVCYTDSNNQAQCGAASVGALTVTQAATVAGGYWQYYTTTYVETDLVTRTTIVSSYCPPVATVAATVTASAAAVKCNYALNESPCGTICCASGQYCYAANQCAAAGAGSSENYAKSFTTPTTVTTPYSAPLRPTTGTLVVITATVSPTTTVPFQTPVATGANVTLTGTQAQTSGGLSGGAIAGIVIGVILGILLLLLLCLYFCFRGAIGLFGGGKGKKRRRTETEYVEEYHHHSGGGSGGGRRWYGDRPSRPPPPPPPKKSSGIGGAAGVAAGLAALWALLGVKRKHDRRQEKSDYTGSTASYSYDYTTSTSESSA